MNKRYIMGYAILVLEILLLIAFVGYVVYK